MVFYKLTLIYIFFYVKSKIENLNHKKYIYIF